MRRLFQTFIVFAAVSAALSLSACLDTSTDVKVHGSVTSEYAIRR